jgi:hypothetical protein
MKWKKKRDENGMKEKFFEVEFVFNCADFSTSLQYVVKIENDTFDRQYHLLSQKKRLTSILFSNQISILSRKLNIEGFSISKTSMSSPFTLTRAASIV